MKLLICSLLWLSLLACNTSGAGCLDPDVLRLSTKSATGGKQIHDLTVMTDFLGARLGRRVEVYDRKNYDELVGDLGRRNVELALLDPKIYVKLRNASVAVSAFLSFDLGEQRLSDSGGYRSILVVRRGSGFDSLASLRGKVLALVGPGSSSGYTIPHLLFPVPAGEVLEDFFGRTLESGDHGRSLQAVARGKVDAAFVASLAFYGLVNEQDYSEQDFVILWRSPPLPAPPLVYSLALCEGLRRDIEQALLSFQHSEAGQVWFADLGVAGLKSADDSDYDLIREMMAADIGAGQGRRTRGRESRVAVK